ncbi:MAG TPA: triose-phosphate isomerase [Anaerolineales bacterium]|nr:triose-phosphate isomerase [Anaerolineales bacterium]
MRTPLVAANWKMNKTVEEARALVYAMSARLREIKGVEKVLCPPYLSLLAVHAQLEGSDLGLGAQNMYWEEKGAYTGEVSPLMVKELCQYVILGHSERRAYFGETDETVNKKIRAAQKFDITPIFCVGETLEQYESKQTAQVVDRQMRLGLAGIDPAFASRVIVAYEPVWAIGTGKASSSENANEVVGKVIRGALSAMFGGEAAQAIRVLYGGSVTGANGAEFFGQSEIDGALVGGASLKPDDFIAITQAAAG